MTAVGEVDEELQSHAYRNDRESSVLGSIIGVEAKASSTVRVDDFKGLRKLAELAGERFTAGYLVYSGERVLSFAQDGLELFAFPLEALF